MGSQLPYALRQWTRHPGFTLTTISILALGIAATTSVFSIVDATLFRLPPWPAIERLVLIHGVQLDQRQNPAFSTRWNRAPISWAAWQDLRQASGFDDVGVWISRPEILGAERSDFVPVFYVSSSFLNLLGVKPLFGSLFTAAEDATISEAVLISHETWQRRFGGRQDIIGRTLLLAPGTSSPVVVKTVIGVLNTGFRFQGETPEFIMPIGVMAYNGSFEANRFLRAVGRLAPGVSLESAAAVAEPLVRRLDPPEKRSARLVWLIDDQTEHPRRSLWLMLAGVVLLLLVACSNVAGLLLSNARARRYEMAVRTTLGASRFSLIRLLSIEYVLLAAVASFVGLTLASWLTPVWTAMMPYARPEATSTSLSVRIVLWTLGLGTTTSLIFGLAPVVSLSSVKPMRALSTGGREVIQGRHGVHQIIVAAQVTLAVVLIVGAALFAETIIQLRSRPVGFDPDGLAIASVWLTRDAMTPVPGNRVRLPAGADQKEVEAFRERGIAALSAGWIHVRALMDRLAALPDVVSVAATATAPFAGGSSAASVRDSTRPFDEGTASLRQIVTERYFETMRIPILKGRGFQESDRRSRPVAVISSELERQLFAGNGLAKQFLHGQVTHEVIGIAGNVSQQAYSDDDLPTFYVMAPSIPRINHFVLRSSGDPRMLLPLVRQTIPAHDRSMTIASATTMEDLLTASLAEERFRGVLSATFGLAAFALAGIGLYALASRLAADRQHEFAMRMCLGAGPGDLCRHLTRDLATSIGSGIAIGIPLAYLASASAASLFFGVTPAAIHIYLIAAGMLLIAAAAALVVPAVRLRRLTPVHALKT